MSQRIEIRVITLEILQRPETVLPKTFEQKIHGGAAVIYGYRFIIKKEKSGRKLINRLEKTENGYQDHASRVKVHFAEAVMQMKNGYY